MIDVKNVSFSYKNKKSVFKSVSFYLKEGEILAVMEELDIAFLKNRFCNEISGGELQLAYIAKALVIRMDFLE